MHGIIHAKLKSFVEEHHGKDAWKNVLTEAGLGNKIYMTFSTYPDEDAIKIVDAASKLTKTPQDKIYEEFGKYIAPDLLGMYKSLIKPEWKTMDLLMHTEETIHRVVRQKNPGADPPKLQFSQVDSNTLKFNYNSPRKMSSVAKGIMQGVADHYGETLTIKENKKPDGSCEMKINVK